MSWDTGGWSYIFSTNNPKAIEKELFTVVVNANQLTVSARREHQILAPNERYGSWLQVAIVKANLEEATDY